MDELGGGILSKDKVIKTGQTSSSTEAGLMSGLGSMTQKRAMTLEEAMGDIKPLELSPELTIMKKALKEVTAGAKVIDGKAIAK